MPGCAAVAASCLATTNIVESPNACGGEGDPLEGRGHGVSLGHAAFLDTEKSFRKIMGYKDLWMLDAILNCQGHSSKGCLVQCSFTPPQTLNYDWDTLTALASRTCGRA